MKQTVYIDGVSIAFLEMHPNASKTIFFIHGNSGSSNTWSKQFLDTALIGFQLIAFDLPGHGESSNSNNPNIDYSPLRTGEILAKAVINLSVNKPYVLVGFSYGTNLIAEMFRFHVDPVGIVLVSMCCIGEHFPMNRVFKQGQQPSLFFYNETNRTTVNDFVEKIVFKKACTGTIAQDYFETDIRFRPALMQTAKDGMLTDEIDALKESGVSICVVFGKHDALVNSLCFETCGLLFWKNKIHLVETAGHFVHLDEPNAVTILIADYANEVFTENHSSRHN